MSPNTNKQNKPVLEALSDHAVIEMLRDLMRFYGVDPDTKDVHQKELIVQKLNAASGEDWGYMYVHNLLKEKIRPSKKMTATILMLGAQADGVPLILSNAREMKLFVKGNVRPGSVVLMDSRDCANPFCKVSFIPKNNFQRYCCSECREFRKRNRLG